MTYTFTNIKFNHHWRSSSVSQSPIYFLLPRTPWECLWAHTWKTGIASVTFSVIISDANMKCRYRIEDKDTRVKCSTLSTYFICQIRCASEASEVSGKEHLLEEKIDRKPNRTQNVPRLGNRLRNKPRSSFPNMCIYWIEVLLLCFFSFYLYSLNNWKSRFAT